ncbi:MAG: acyl-CoA dehydrogenase family protein [Firmicutes bacterium]|nr:acyl-CoA dehydrogenase family protein [Bacillota bacterium]
MDFALSEEERSIRAAIRDLAEREFAPRAAEYDRTGEFPWDNVRLLAEGGYLGMTVPPRYGGAGASFLAFILCMEEVARACAVTSVIFEVHNSLHIEPILRFGSEEQRERFLPPLVRGERLGAFCLTEPSSGSDAAAMETRAVEVAGGFRLRGQKSFITNGGQAHEYLVFARTGDDPGRRAVTAFLVPRDSPGLSFGPPEAKMGLTASHTTQVYLDDVFVPADRLLGERDHGMRVALATLDAGRVGIAAQAVGIAQAALDTAARYALERRQFGRPIAEHEGVQWILAEMAADLEAARWLVYRAAWLQGQGIRATEEIAKAKLFASTMANVHVPRALRVLGGYGFLKDHPMERYVRDVKVTEIYEGTSEVMKMLIARGLMERTRQGTGAG